MVRYKSNILVSDSGIVQSLILNSKDLLPTERDEEKINLELAVLIEAFHKNKTVDIEQLKDVVQKFMRDVTIILTKLELAKRKAKQEETRKIDNIRQLLEEGSKSNSQSLREELEKLGEGLKSNTISILKSHRRRENRLARGKAPLGYVLKRLMQNRDLDTEIIQKAMRIGKDIPKEHKLFSEVDFLIKELNKNPNKKTLSVLKRMIRLLVNKYQKDLDDSLIIESDVDIQEARKFHRIDQYITFLKMLVHSRTLPHDSKDLIRKFIIELNGLKERAKTFVYQDAIDAKKLVIYAKTLVYGLKINFYANLDEVCSDLTALLTENGITIKLLHRAKTRESMERKLQSLPGVKNVVELLVIVNTEQDCYEVADIIESKYGLEKKTDYIKKPWSTGYQSLHINYRYDSETVAQLEVRTPEMHTHALELLREHGPRFWERPGFKK